MIPPNLKTWTIHFEAMPVGYDAPPPERRMAALLKSALRTHRFRCVHAVCTDIPSTLPPVPVDLDPCKTEPPFAPQPSGNGSNGARCDIKKKAAKNEPANRRTGKDGIECES